MAKRPSNDIYNEAKSRSGESKKTLKHIEVKPAMNGGHVVTHHYNQHGMGYHEPDEYAFGSGPETVHHLMDHLGVKENEMIDHLEGTNDEDQPGKPKEEGTENYKGAHKTAKRTKKHKETEAEEKGED